MRFQSGITDQYIYFVAVDSTDLKTRETGLSSFTVYRSRNGGAATAYTTPTIAEVSSSNMPGVYSLLLDEDMTIDSGDDSQAVVLHITQASMAPVTLMYELYRPIVTAGTTITVANGCADADIERLQGSAIATPSVAGVLEVDVTHFNGTAGTFTSGRPEVNTTHAAGTAWNSGAISASTLAADTLTAAKVAADVGTEIGTAVWATAARTLTAATNITSTGGSVPITAGGLVSSDVTAISTDATAANNLEAALDGTGGVTITAGITGNITGNLSGSVGSVTGAVGSVTAGVTVTTNNDKTGYALSAAGVDAIWDEATSGHVTAGSYGVAITDILADTNELQTDWTNGGRLDLILDARASQASVDAIQGDIDGMITELTNIQGALTTIDGIVDSILVDTAEIGVAGAGLTAIPWNAAWDAEVQSEVSDALTAYGASTVTNASVADAVWDEALAGHLGAGSTGEALNAAGAAGDPWTTSLPGAYGAGSAGYIIGTNINATISSRATQTSVDTLDDYVDTEIAAIKAKTDQLTFTVAGQVDSNIQYVNDVQVTGDGQPGTEWGP